MYSVELLASQANDPNPQLAQSEAKGVNNLGQAVGWFQLGGENYTHACVWEVGVSEPLQLPVPTATAAGFDGLVAEKINDAGEIVGFGTRPHPGGARGLRWTALGFSELPNPLFSANVWPLALSNPGAFGTLAVGYANGGTNNVSIAIGWTGGVPLALASGRPFESSASDVNNHGIAAGWLKAQGSHRVAAVFDVNSGGQALWAPLDETASRAHGINDDGVVVGAAGGGVNDSPARWVSWLQRDVLPLPTGFARGWANAVNMNRDMVGSMLRPDGSSVAFVAFGRGRVHIDIPGFGSGSLPGSWVADPVIVDLNSLIDPSSGWILEAALDINNAGVIVGRGQFAGKSSGFRLIPGAREGFTHSRFDVFNFIFGDVRFDGPGGILTRVGPKPWPPWGPLSSQVRQQLLIADFAHRLRAVTLRGDAHEIKRQLEKETKDFLRELEGDGEAPKDRMD